MSLLRINKIETKEKIEKKEKRTGTQKTNITDLFRKITKNTEKEDIHSDNIIEQIYNKKELSEPKFEKLTEKSENIQPNRSTMQDKKMDVFKELIAMQQRLKQETQNDPSLQTNIDKLIQNTKKIQEDNAFEPLKNDVIVEEKNELTKEEQVITNEDNQEPIKLEEETQEYEVIQNEIQNDNDLNKEQEEKNSEKQENATEITEETKSFTNEEINEMMDKLEKMDDVNTSPEFANMYEKIFGKLPASVEEEKKKEEEKISAYELIKDNNISVFENTEEYKKPTYKLVGIAFNTYIIIEIQNELYIIDQHAAHERVMYERVKENYYSDSNKDSQMLLLPDIITLTHKEMDILKDNYEMFEKAGFVLEEFGDNTIKVSGVPNICLDLDTKELFLETLDEINQVARTAKQEIEERFIATVACKAAVKANMDLTNEEVDSLMNDLLKLPNPFTCPHGRPTAIKMNKNDIERKFARRK